MLELISEQRKISKFNHSKKATKKIILKTFYPRAGDDDDAQE